MKHENLQIGKHALKKGMSLLLTAAMLITGMPDLARAGASGQKESREQQKLCELTFDDADNPLNAGNAAAEAPNSYDTSEHDDGKALKLNGTNQYLSITAADGSSILKGKEEFTISYDINNLRTSTNWSFYAAPDDKAQNWATNTYLGCLYSGSSMTVERYKNGRGAPESGTASVSSESGWRHYDVVVHEDGIRIFKDGVLSATTTVTAKVSDILGYNGVFYIGRANWGSGEYCNAEIDNFIIYDGIKSSLTDAVIKDVYDGLSVPETAREDIELPVRKLGADIAWSSSNSSVITEEGIVTRGREDEQVTLTAVVSAGESGSTLERTFDVTVPKDDGISVDDFLVGAYSFDDNTKNECDATGQDEAEASGKSFASYTGEIKYEDGIKGRAVRVGDYGFKLNKKNIGNEFTVSMWVKPDGKFPENHVMLFLGHHNPERWLGVSGNNGTDTLKIWGKGGTLSTWTTLFSPRMSAGVWHNLVLTGTDGTVSSYLDGVKIGEDNRSNNPLSGENQDIYIAVNNWDSLFKGLVDDVKVYSTPLSMKQIQNNYNSMIVKNTADNFWLEETENLRENITLPSEAGDGVRIEWSTSDASVITNEGVITRSGQTGIATLTAAFTLGDAVEKKEFAITVAAVDDENDVNNAKQLLSIPVFAADDIALPETGAYDTVISWESSDEEIMDSTGKLGSKRPAVGAGNATVILTAAITKGNSTAVKEFEVTVMEQPYGYILGYVRGSNDRTGSLHIACSTDRETFAALNGNAGILFAANDTSDGNKNLSTGIRFAGIGLCRNEDGSFAMIAPQGKNSEAYYVYNSNDLLTYNGGELITSGKEGYEKYKSMYEAAKTDVSQMAVPEGASGCSIAAVTKAEYDTIVKRFDVVTNEKVTLGVDSVTVNTESELAGVLPKTATATYSDGSEAALNIKWDTDTISMNKAGTYTLTGSVVPYSNPLIEQRADPQIKYDETGKCYYFTASYPAFNNVNNGYDRIVLRKADSIQELSDDNGGKDKEITIWKAPADGKMSRHVWAPELQKINGKWYVFFAAGNSDNIWAIRPYVLVCQNNEDPYNEESWKLGDGSYEIHAATSLDSRYFKNMSLDMTYLENNGRHYVIWADIIGQSALYMQEIDPDSPWNGTSDKVVMLTTPEFGWERDTERVNEGPTILKHDGKIFCAFSASGTGPEYCIGMLYADEDADLMDAASWTKLGYPLLTSSDVPGEYGPGHNSFTVDLEGNPVFVYHARSEECYRDQCEWASSNSLYDPCRHARVKNVHWTEDGLPILKMSAEQECPEQMRNLSIQVTVESDSGMNLSEAVISGYEKEYEETGSQIAPAITAAYKETVLEAGRDYTVEYGENTSVGKGTITIKAVEGTDYFGEKTVEFDIIQKPVVKAEYDMSSDGKTLDNLAGDNYDAAVKNLSQNNFVSYNDTNIMKLDNNGYAELPKGVVDDNTFTISVVASTEKANDQWLVSLGKDSWNYAFLTPTNKDSKTKFTVAQQEPDSNKTGAYGQENTIAVNSVGKNGSFHVYTAVVNENKTALYVDGVKVGTGNNPFDITSFFEGLDVIGYIGKSLYAADPLFSGSVGRFIVYDNALTDAQVARETADIDLDSYVAASIYGIMLKDNTALDNIKSNLSFPASVAGTRVTWEIPEDQSVIDENGNVVRPVDDKDVQVAVKATWQGADGEKSETFTFTVKAQTIDSVLDDVVLPYSSEKGKEVYGNITLPVQTANGIPITWQSDHPEIVDVNSHKNEGYDDTPAGTVKRPASDTIVKLTASITVNGKKGTKEYVFTVKAAPDKIKEEDYTDYFFAYFIGEGRSQGEQIYFASSEDGMNWTDLNDGKPSLISTMGEKGVRDPYIIRSAEGDKFYIIATDLKINGGSGWNAAQTAGSQSLMIWESTDLVNWSNQRMVEVSASIGAGCTWAPEATYDAKTGEYIVYWASKVEEDGYSKQRLYYAKTRDFYSFTEPEVYIDIDQSTIDTTMIEHNGTYYRYSKNEGGSDNKYGAHSKTIFIEKSSGVLGEFSHIASASLNGNGGVEGPTIFKLNKDDAPVDTWCLLVDNYGKGGYYPLITTDLESGKFEKPAAGTYKMPSNARHGTPIRVTREEYCKIMNIPYNPDETAPPKPTEEPKPTDTPKPTEEPNPTAPPKPTDTPNPPQDTPKPEPDKPVASATPNPPVVSNAPVTPSPQPPADQDVNLTVKQSKTKGSVEVKWTAVRGADSYRVYYALRGNKYKRYKKVKGSKRKVKINKLKKGRYYKIKLCAYKTVGGKKKRIFKSPVMYIVTRGGRYTKPVSVKLTTKSVSVRIQEK